MKLKSFISAIAVFALAAGSVAFSNLSASAAGELNIVPTSGSGWGTLNTDHFSMRINFAGSKATQTTVSDLRYELTSSSDFTATDGVTSLFSGIPLAGDHTVVVAPSNPTAAGNQLILSLNNTSSSGSIRVRTFVDANQDATFSAGEWNEVRTITFVTLQTAEISIEPTQPISLDTSVMGRLVIGGVNPDQVQENFTLEVSGYSSRTRVYTELGQATFGAGLDFSVDLNRPLNAAEALSLRVQLGDTFDGSLSSLVEVFPIVKARAISGLHSQLFAGSNAKNTSCTDGTNPLGGTIYCAGQSGDVRKDGIYAVQVVGARDAQGQMQIVPSIELGSGTTVSIDGITYTSTNELEAAIFKFTFDSENQAKFEVKTTGFNFGDSLNFFFQSEGYQVQTTSTVVELRFVLFDLEDKLNNNFRSIAPDTDFTVRYSMKDQFGVAPEAGRFAVSTPQVDGLASAHSDFVSGLADLTLHSPATPRIHLYSLEPQVWIYGSQESFSQAIIYDNVDPEDGFSLRVAPKEQVTPKLISAAPISSDPVLDTGGVFTNFDGRFSGVTHYTHGQRWKLSVQGEDVLHHSIAGQSINISGKGLEFVAGNQGGFESLTLLADQFGEVEFNVYSHKSGTMPFSVQAGAASGSGNTTWVPLTLSYVTAVTPVASFAKGQTVSIDYNGFDQYGNVCADTYLVFGAKLSGVGYLLGPLSDPWDLVDIAFVNGKGYVKLVNDLAGDATVVVKNVSSQVHFGLPAASISTPSKKKRIVYLDWSFFPIGVSAMVTVNGQTKGNFATGTNGSGHVPLNLKKGTNKIRVYADGRLIYAKDLIIRK